MQYTIRVTNTGGGVTGSDSVVVLDSLPVEVSLYVDDLDGSGSGPIRFTDGSPGSGLTYTFGGLADAMDNLEFDDGTLNYIYVPVPDTNGYDVNVRAVRVNPQGAMATSTSGDPYFELTFQAQVK